MGSTFGTSGEFTGNGAYGVCINSGTSDRYIITNNIFNNNGAGALLDGGSGTNKIVTPNITA